MNSETGNKLQNWCPPTWRQLFGPWQSAQLSLSPPPTWRLRPSSQAAPWPGVQLHPVERLCGCNRFKSPVKCYANSRNVQYIDRLPRRSWMIDDDWLFNILFLFSFFHRSGQQTAAASNAVLAEAQTAGRSRCAWHSNHRIIPATDAKTPVFRSIWRICAATCGTISLTVPWNGQSCPAVSC